MKRTISLFAALSITVMAIAQAYSSTIPEHGVEKNMPLFYQQLKEQLTFPWAWQNKVRQNADGQKPLDFDEWRNEARRQVFATMQIAPPAPENYSYEVIAREQRDGYEAQKIRFHINKWEETTAYLLVPKQSSGAAILMLHDHGAHFTIGKEKMVKPFAVDSIIMKDADDWATACYDGRYVGDELAKAGYVILSIDALFWGDRSRLEDRTDLAKSLATKENKQKTYDTQQALSSNLLQLGTSWGAWITWDDIRAAEFLARLPFVDPERVGCLGFSMGSYRSWMLAALSDVIKASANVCWMNDTEHLMSLTNNQNKGGSAYSMLIPGIRNLMDYPHVASLACPKPTLFYNGDRDKLFPVPGVEASYQTMREVWQTQGVNDNLVTKIWPEKHFLNRAMQDSITVFFNQHLNNTIDKKPAKSAEKKQVSPVAQQQEELIKTFLQVNIPKRSAEIKAPENGDALPMLQQAIDQLAVQGGGTLNVQKGTYHLNGSLIMKSNISLCLAKGALLLFSGKATDYLPVVRTRWEGTELLGRSAMIYANGAENIAITGEGTIDAQGGLEMAKWGMQADTRQFEENTHGTHGETVEMPDVRRLRYMGDVNTPLEERVYGEGTFLRPCAIEFYGCNKVLLEGITLKNSPFWCIHPVYSENITVRNVTIDSHFPNNDGCDPESSRNVLIENCTFRTGDDAIAIKAGRDADGRRVGKPSENIVIRHCKFYSECNGLCIGSEMSGGVKNVLMYDVEIGNVKNALLFKSNLDRGGYIRDVQVDKISINSVKGAVLRFETNYFGYRGGNYPAQYERFRISNVTAGDAEGYAIYYDGPGFAPTAQVIGKSDKNRGYPIRDITVSDFHVKSATHPYYLYNTDRCRFLRSTVGGTAIPEYPEESPSRQQCDVW